MNLPPDSRLPLDPPPADPVENRLRQAVPAPLNAALMARLRLARPDLETPAESASDSKQDSPPASFTAEELEKTTVFNVTMAADPQVIPFPGADHRRRRPGSRGFWSIGSAAAALALCGWVGWKAAAPALPGEGGPGQGNPVTAEGSAFPTPHDSSSDPGAANSDGSLEFLPALESRQHLLSVEDLGVFRDSRQRPVQLMSTTWLDENTYGSTLDPELRESRVRHEIVPVVLPTY